MRRGKKYVFFNIITYFLKFVKCEFFVLGKKFSCSRRALWFRNVRAAFVIRARRYVRACAAGPISGIWVAIYEGQLSSEKFAYGYCGRKFGPFPRRRPVEIPPYYSILGPICQASGPKKNDFYSKSLSSTFIILAFTSSNKGSTIS